MISSIIRLPFLHGLNQSKDPTWDVPNIATWSIAELGPAITLTRIPAIRPLFAHYFPNVMGSLAGKSGHGGSNQTPAAGGTGRTKKTTEFSAPETTATKTSKQDWHQYIELDDQDDARSKRSADVESQDNILRPDGRHVARAR